MKHFIFIIALTFGFSNLISAQDTTSNKKQTQAKQVQEYDTVLIPKKRTRITFRNKKKIYRPTRLGSSSPLYDTYQRNDRGAGAVTTNPNKGAGAASPVVTVPRAGLDSSVIEPKDSSGMEPFDSTATMRRADSTQLPKAGQQNRNSKKAKRQKQ